MNRAEKWQLPLNRCPDAVKFQFEDGEVRAQALGGGTFEAGGAALRTDAGAHQLRVTLIACEKPLMRVFLRWKTRIPQGVRVLGDHWERGYGDMEWRGLVPERVLPWYFLLADRDGNNCGAGVMVRPNALCWWQADASGVTLALDVRCGGMGFVPAGETELCMVRVLPAQAGESAFAAARRLAAALCPEVMRRLPKAPVYGGNNWYYAYGSSSSEEILGDARRIAELTEGLSNRPFMVIDDGWQTAHGGGYNGGPWDRSNADYPDMAALARGMKEMDVRPGIWLRPLLTKKPVPERWKLQRDIPQRELHGGCVLDPSVPEVLDEIAADFARLEEWGYELIKQDFTTFDLLGRWGVAFGAELTDGTWRFADRSKTTAMVIKDLYDAMRRGVSDDTLLMGCNTMPHLSAGVFELSRTGDDTSGRIWERTRLMGPNTLAFRMPQHDIFQSCDADCVGLTRNVSWAMNEKWLDVLARSGTPLFVSAAPDALGDAQKQALRAAFRMASEPRTPAEPLDWMETTCPRALENAGGRSGIRLVRGLRRGTAEEMKRRKRAQGCALRSFALRGKPA